MRLGRRRPERLSPIYLDDDPVTLMGDEALPPLSRIVRAGGKEPEDVDVVYLTSPRDRHGRTLEPEMVIDRTAEPTRPIYLRSVPRPTPEPWAQDGARPTRDDLRRSGDLPPEPDRVIDQLGRDAVWPRRHHRPWVFRSPTRSGGDSADTEPTRDGAGRIRPNPDPGPPSVPDEDGEPESGR